MRRWLSSSPSGQSVIGRIPPRNHQSEPEMVPRVSTLHEIEFDLGIFDLVNRLVFRLGTHAHPLQH